MCKRIRCIECNSFDVTKRDYNINKRIVIKDYLHIGRSYIFGANYECKECGHIFNINNDDND